MSDARTQASESTRDAEADELWRSYLAAIDALRRDELPGFTTEDEFLRYASSRS